MGCTPSSPTPSLGLSFGYHSNRAGTYRPQPSASLQALQALHNDHNITSPSIIALPCLSTHLHLSSWCSKKRAPGQTRIMHPRKSGMGLRITSSHLIIPKYIMQKISQSRVPRSDLSVILTPITTVSSPE